MPSANLKGGLSKLGFLYWRFLSEDYSLWIIQAPLLDSPPTLPLNRAYLLIKGESQGRSRGESIDGTVVPIGVPCIWKLPNLQWTGRSEVSLTLDFTGSG